jgi:hypothetical protein
MAEIMDVGGQHKCAYGASVKFPHWTRTVATTARMLMMSRKSKSSVTVNTLRARWTDCARLNPIRQGDRR